MGSRHTGRKLAMQAIYQAEIQKEDIEDILSDFIIDSAYIEETKSWALELSRKVHKHLQIIDNLIVKYSIAWDIKRLNLIDKSILRIAFYELNYTKTDISVILDEAIVLAKKYSTDDSPKFINGILGNYVEKECLQELPKK